MNFIAAFWDDGSFDKKLIKITVEAIIIDKAILIMYTNLVSYIRVAFLCLAYSKKKILIIFSSLK